jgi:hypothetical protein
MDVDNSSTSPPQGKQGQVRVRKLRLSCDACSSSKIKCDQTRPICLRCQKTGVKCSYSVSQRKGKPPAASRDPSVLVNGRKGTQAKQASKSAEEKLSPPNHDSQHAACDSAFHFEQDSSMMEMSVSMYEDAINAPWQTSIPDMSDYTSNDITMTPSNIFDQTFFSMDTSPMSQLTPRSPDDIFNFEEEFPDVLGIGLQESPRQAELQFHANSLPTPPSSDYGPQTQRYDCSKLAASTLNSLNILSSQSCSASATQGHGSMDSNLASFDQILIINKSAVENAHQLLSCPCSLSQQFNLTLSLIIDKILALYQNIIHTETSVRQMSPSESSERLVRDTPITIGAYKMDAKDEQRIRMQLVRNELRKATALVDRYADRYCTLGCQERENNEVYTALTSLLRRRSKKAVSDIVNALRESGA